MELADGRAPRPSCRPLGTVVCDPAAAPGCRKLWYRRSWNCVRRDLNPAVLAFARLCAILSMLICCAFMPLPALYKARIISLVSLLSDARHFLHGVLVHLRAKRER